MDIYQEVKERDNYTCQACYGPGEEIHHIIYGRGKRKEHENIDSLILLCRQCHRGTNGVHGKNGHKLNMRLKRALQAKYFKQGYSEEEVRELMGGRLYWQTS